MYRDYKSSFKELLQKDKSMAIHQRNVQYLAIEIYKVRMVISPKIMNEIFRFSKTSVYSLRIGIQLEKVASILFNLEVNLQSISEQKSGN